MVPNKLKTRLCALLPFSTAVQLFGVLIFLIVELSGAAGGTSGVAGTRTVFLFLLYWMLFALSLQIGRQQGCVSFNDARFSIVDVRSGGMQTLGPVASLLRGIKIIFEILVHMTIALPSILAAIYGWTETWRHDEAGGTTREDAQRGAGTGKGSKLGKGIGGGERGERRKESRSERSEQRKGEESDGGGAGLGEHTHGVIAAGVTPGRLEAEGESLVDEALNRKSCAGTSTRRKLANTCSGPLPCAIIRILG
ncbi:hypothetical protein GUITHDRAFT_138790 [Guillardia theta CCMP2712]|uniref:Uncharacterized protein n=1 Tax=Guillardia theta (strain CCMP2712) TaxID=905079 RepID=L1JAK5_GUITC|nr:hypothetical protein GUITHDRAFT_138790 [Guillardia theta CCMP2712]EKX45561.1 hypothetical protein GUITHDRAFT_138790 [Guillardia theta CCMP2712]|eukprot:XP_005832541.1 hypothetical protein GUITHDRAFT_138790 [Guillardia theta CCMP2712]